MAARLSPGSWTDAAGVAAQAQALRERALQLVDEDAEAYRRALEARAAADEAARPEQRDWALGLGTAAAAEPPLALVRLAADLTELCAAAGARGGPRRPAPRGGGGGPGGGARRGGRGPRPG